jgi:hypothetical protein
MKRGSSHLEIILSFTLFVSFTLFMIVFINPVKGGLLQDSVIAGLEGSFLDSVGVDLIKFPVRPFEEGCLNLDVSTFGNVNSFVSTLGGLEVSSEVSSGNLLIESSDEVLWVYLSEGLSLDGASCSDPVSYEVGSFEKVSLISWEKLQEFKANYTSNYMELKDELNFPLSRDFGIECLDCGDYDLTQPIPEDVDVFADSSNSRVLYGNGTIKDVEFTLRVW